MDFQGVGLKLDHSIQKLPDIHQSKNLQSQEIYVSLTNIEPNLNTQLQSPNFDNPMEQLNMDSSVHDSHRPEGEPGGLISVRTSLRENRMDTYGLLREQVCHQKPNTLVRAQKNC